MRERQRQPMSVTGLSSLTVSFFHLVVCVGADAEEWAHIKLVEVASPAVLHFARPRCPRVIDEVSRDMTRVSAFVCILCHGAQEKRKDIEKVVLQGLSACANPGSKFCSVQFIVSTLADTGMQGVTAETVRSSISQKRTLSPGWLTRVAGCTQVKKFVVFTNAFSYARVLDYGSKDLGNGSEDCVLWESSFHVRPACFAASAARLERSFRFVLE